MDNKLRQLERVFQQSPTYYNLAALEKERQRISEGDPRDYSNLSDQYHEVIIDGVIWGSTVYYRPASIEYGGVVWAEVVYVIVEDDDLGLEVDITPLLSDKKVKAIEDYLTESDWDSYNNWLDNVY